MTSKFYISGEKSRLAAVLQKPEGPENCPLVILMHGFMSSKRLEPLKSIAKALEKEGIASLRFDFDGHGSSDGRFCDMTVQTELSDAEKVCEYAFSLPWPTSVSLLGHSQGGVVAGMTAARYGKDKIACLVQLAAAAVLKDDAINGVLMGKHYDPANPPEHLWVFLHKVGRGYFLCARDLPIYEESSKYTGPVLLIHGKEDKIVPYSYSERYDSLYADSRLILLEGENHILSRKRAEVISESVAFIKTHVR